MADVAHYLQTDLIHLTYGTMINLLQYQTYADMRLAFKQLPEDLFCEALELLHESGQNFTTHVLGICDGPFNEDFARTVAKAWPLLKRQLRSQQKMMNHVLDTLPEREDLAKQLHFVANQVDEELDKWDKLSTKNRRPNDTLTKNNVRTKIDNRGQAATANVLGKGREADNYYIPAKNTVKADPKPHTNHSASDKAQRGSPVPSSQPATSTPKGPRDSHPPPDFDPRHYYAQGRNDSFTTKSGSRHPAGQSQRGTESEPQRVPSAGPSTQDRDQALFNLIQQLRDDFTAQTQKPAEVRLPQDFVDKVDGWAAQLEKVKTDLQKEFNEKLDRQRFDADFK